MKKSDLKIFSSEGHEFYEKSIPFDAVSGPYGEERAIILRSLKIATKLTALDSQFIKINGVLFLIFGENEGITFQDNEVPNIIGFNGFHDGSGYHIGYKMLDSFENLTMADAEKENFWRISF